MRRVSESLPRIRVFVALRYTLIIATAYLLLVEHEFSSLPSGLILLIVVALTSNVVIARLPARITDSTAFNASIILGDTAWITAALLYSGLFSAELFYLYFFLLLLAAIGENLGLIAVGALVVCTAYVLVLSLTGGFASFWSSRVLIHIPFLFTAAAFYGYLVDRVRHKQQHARAEADTVARLEHEISGRKRVERALRESEERYRKAVELSPDAILVHSEGTIDYVNTAGGVLLGASDAEQLIGTPVMDIIHPDYREVVKERIQQRIDEGTVLPLIEEKMIRLDGTEVDVEVTAAAITYHDKLRVQAVIRDITERKRADEALRTLVEGTASATGDDFFRSLVRNIASAFRVRYGIVSEFTDVNTRVRILAFWTGDGFLDSFEKDLADTPCERVLAGEIRHYAQGVQTLFPKDKDLVKLGAESYLAIPLMDPLSNVIGHLALIDDKPMHAEARDMSIFKIFATRASAELERKWAEEELKGAQLQLMQSAKLESVGRLAAGVAHEVKNPLAIIRQGLAYLSHAVSTTDDDTVAQVLGKMDNAITRADRVVRGLLDFSAPTAVDVGTVELNAALEQGLLLVKHELDRAHVTVVKALGALPPLQLDQQKMEQVFVNLFMNAIQAMPDGGTLTIKTYSKPLTEFGPDGGHRKSDQFRIGETLIVLEVEDTGSGIPDDKLDRVFDPFFTTKPNGEGSGLGLTVTRKIVELHRGTIDIRNRQEGGVQVTLIFKTEGGHADAEEADPAR